MFIYSKKVIIGAALALVMIVSSFTSTNNENKGYEILKQVHENLTGYNSYSVDMTMKLIKNANKSFERKVRTFSQERDGNGDLQISIFMNPSDVKGTKLLSHANYDDTDDQWIFFPALKKVKRIANENKSGPFLGSEIAYEDLGNAWLYKFNYEYLGEKQYKGENYYLVKSIPKSRYSGYSYVLAYVDKDKMLVDYHEYYDRRGELLKEEKTAYKYYEQAKCWLPDYVETSNVRNGRKTVLKWTNYQFNKNITKEYFQVNQFQWVKG